MAHQVSVESGAASAAPAALPADMALYAPLITLTTTDAVLAGR